MILFKAKRDGTVETLPMLVPQGSAMQDLVVVSEMDYAYCSIHLEPASKVYIEPILCQPVTTDEGNTILWTASLHPEATKVPGTVGYQLIFTAPDGTTQTTLPGTFTVPRGYPAIIPEKIEDLSNSSMATIHQILSILVASNTSINSEIDSIQGNINKIFSDISNEVRISSITVNASQWTDSTPKEASVMLPGVGTSDTENTVSYTALLLPANDETRLESREIGIYVDRVGFGAGGFVGAIFKRDGEAPSADLKYVIIVFTEKNQTGKEFKATASFVGIGGGASSDGGDLPAVNNSDNGKFLQVVDGQWAATTIPAAEGVSV